MITAPQKTVPQAYLQLSEVLSCEKKGKQRCNTALFGLQFKELSLLSKALRRVLQAHGL